MKATDKEKHLDSLVGQQLSAVTFVQDYLQLDFDGRLLTINDWPTLLAAGTEFRIEEFGYRDQLCSLIAKSVLEVEQSEAAILIVFANGSQIQIDLLKSKMGHGDRVIFNDTVDGSWSWW